MNIGILFAVGALFGWAFGDFFIQKTVRKIGNIRALFYITAAGGILILPFIWREILPAFSDTSNWLLIIIACALVMLTALANFQGLKLGKLAVVMPINGLEIIVAVLLAMAIGQEIYDLKTFLFIILVLIGLTLISVVSLDKIKKLKLENGVGWAIIGAIGLGASDYVIGHASRTFSPLFAIWLTHSAVAVFSGLIMLKTRTYKQIKHDLNHFMGLIGAQSFLDNASWISFAYATIHIPIGIATTISEGYLIVAVMLGLLINKEKIKIHQTAGMVLALIGIMALSLLTV